MRRRWPPECSVSDSLFSSVPGRREDTHVRMPMERPLLAHSSLARGFHPGYLIADPSSRASGVGSCPRDLVGMQGQAPSRCPPRRVRTRPAACLTHEPFPKIGIRSRGKILRTWIWAGRVAKIALQMTRSWARPGSERHAAACHRSSQTRDSRRDRRQSGECTMPDVDPDRIRMMAEAARVPLRADAPARIARAVAPTVTRFGAEKLALALETEPSTFVVVQRREIEP